MNSGWWTVSKIVWVTIKCCPFMPIWVWNYFEQICDKIYWPGHWQFHTIHTFYKRTYSDILYQRTVIKDLCSILPPSHSPQAELEQGGWTPVSKCRTWPAFLTIPIQGISVYVCCRGVTTARGCSLELHHKSILSSRQMITLLGHAQSNNSLPLLLDFCYNLCVI